MTPARPAWAMEQAKELCAVIRTRFQADLGCHCDRIADALVAAVEERDMCESESCSQAARVQELEQRLRDQQASGFWGRAAATLQLQLADLRAQLAALREISDLARRHCEALRALPYDEGLAEQLCLDLEHRLFKHAATLATLGEGKG